MVSSKYHEAGLDPGGALVFPIEVIVDQLDQTSLQLWHKAPSQYQEYDRLRAESSFRAGVSLPLVAIAVLVGLQLSWWLSALITLGAVVLALQTQRIDRERDSLMANALFQKIAESAVLDSVVRELKAAEVPRGTGSLAWSAHTAIAFDAVGEYEWSDNMVSQAVTEISESVDYEEPDWKKTVEGQADIGRSIFSAGDRRDLLKIFDRRVADRVARTEKLLEVEEDDLAARRNWRR